MVEAENLFEEYAQMSPRERNEEVRKIFNSIPVAEDEDSTSQLTIDDLRLLMETPGFSDTEGFEPEFLKADAEFIKREYYQDRETISKRLAALLCFAHVTNSFKKVIIDRFDLVFVAGADEEKIELYSLLSNRGLENDGIFGERKDKILETERVWYKQERKSFLRRWAKLHQREDSSADVYREVIERVDGGFLGTWRQEFITLFGEEP